MIYTEIELMEMAQDYRAMERRAVEDAEELRRLREGELVVMPRDIEHARAMFKLASYYLTQHDPEFGLTHELIHRN
jgi:hypothetical protein